MSYKEWTIKDVESAMKTEEGKHYVLAIINEISNTTPVDPVFALRLALNRVKNLMIGEDDE